MDQASPALSSKTQIKLFISPHIRIQLLLFTLSTYWGLVSHQAGYKHKPIMERPERKTSNQMTDSKGSLLVHGMFVLTAIKTPFPVTLLDVIEFQADLNRLYGKVSEHFSIEDIAIHL